MYNREGFFNNISMTGRQTPRKFGIKKNKVIASRFFFYLEVERSSIIQRN